jgi:hypothetical protein
MAITFKYGAPGPILAAGFAAGVGSRQQRQQEDALEIWQQQNQQQFQAGQAAINRRFQYGMQEQQFGNQLELQNLRFQEQALQDQETRAFQAEQAGLGRDFQAGQTSRLIEARNADSAMDRDQRSQLLQQQQNFAREQATQEGLRSGALELPPEAQNRLRQLESGRVEAMKLDPVQQKEFMDQSEKEKSTLLGLAQPAKQPTIGEQFDQGTIERGGTLYQRGRDGNFDVLREAPEDTSQADMEKYSKLLQAEAIRLAKDKEDTEGDLSSYVEQAKKNLAGVGFAEPTQAAPQQAQPQPVAGQLKQAGQFGPPQPQATTQQPAATPQQPTSLLTPQDIAAINAGGSMHDDLRFRKGPDGQTISGSTDLKGNFVPHAQQNAGVTDMYGRQVPSRDMYGRALGAQGQPKSQEAFQPPAKGTVSLANKWLPKPTSKSEFDALPPGTLYTGTDGVIKQKP